MAAATTHSYFSISFQFVTVEQPLFYDLYINSSAATTKDHFVRIFPKGGVLEESDLVRFRDKYHQLYVHEGQRDLYLKSLLKNANVSNVKKTEVIKESAIHYLDTLFNKDKIFQTEILGEAIAGCRESVETMVEVVQDYSINDIQELIANLSFHDFYTYDHSINVSMYNISIFKTMKPHASKQELILAGMGGLLHDLGKINIPTHIINNPGRLSDEEFAIIKQHPEAGKKLVEQQVKNFGNLDIEVIKRVIAEHHENYNGSGYPGKLQGKDIHVFARITALADFFDAITTKRSYHEVLSTDEAIAVMAKSVGKKLDPDLFEVLAQNVRKLVSEGIRRELPDDFDPCQPHKSLPFKELDVHKQEHDLFGKQEKKDFGKIKMGSVKHRGDDKIVATGASCDEIDEGADDEECERENDRKAS